jgi:hypothetical protein
MKGYRCDRAKLHFTLMYTCYVQLMYTCYVHPVRRESLTRAKLHFTLICTCYVHLVSLEHSPLVLLMYSLNVSACMSCWGLYTVATVPRCVVWCKSQSKWKKEIYTCTVLVRPCTEKADDAISKRSIVMHRHHTMSVYIVCVHIHCSSKQTNNKQTR